MSEADRRVNGEAAEVAPAEARPCSRWCRTRTPRPSRRPDRRDRGRRGRGRDAQALEELLELGLQTGRLRALYGPGGEQAALEIYRRLPRGGELTETARELNEALSALEGRTLEKVSVTAVGPGEYGVTISTEDYEIVLRLGRAGARLATIGA